MSHSKRALIIIPAASKNEYNTACAAVDLTSVGDTFTVGLVPLESPGAEPTHYICSWACTNDQYSSLIDIFVDDENSFFYDGLVNDGMTVMSLLGLSVKQP